MTHTIDCASQRINHTTQPVDQLPCDCADLGLHVDMLDVDFLRHLANGSLRGTARGERLANLADRLALEIADVGKLRNQEAR